VFEESEVDKETKKKDNAWRVRAIFCLLKKMFNDCLPASGEHLSFDEGMGRFFGRVTGLKKHMPNKPIKEGFKFFVAVDYDSGGCFDINMADGNPIDLTDDTKAVEYRFYYKCWCACLRPPTICAKSSLAYNA
jgi:hypothetical protein